MMMNYQYLITHTAAGSKVAFAVGDDHTVLEISPDGISTKTWSFDRVYGPEVETEEVRMLAQGMVNQDAKTAAYIIPTDLRNPDRI